ncbi:NmrA family transcriptional regulator [Actinocorallia longicatena]|uniref:NAD(P)H-binding protein n=1 Tax=Actinocorallia longicatena TaxID=111803 RepID=A0ABP6Q832_9ACTN
MNTNENILVIGGTGKTGRRVVERLTALGVPVRGVSRPVFDWTDESTWKPVLDEASIAYVTYSPDLAVPGAAEIVGRFAALAVEQGVRRIVLLSGRGEAGALEGERAVQDSGVQEWTIVRAAWFDQNFSEDFLVEAVRQGEIMLPAGTVAEPFVDLDDLADVATAALTRDGHHGQVYEVTGPRLLTFHDVAAVLTEATGRPVAYVPVTTEQYVETMAAYEVPGEVVALLTHLFTEVLDGRNAYLTNGVERALGRAPRDFADYARAAAATGAWDAAR